MTLHRSLPVSLRVMLSIGLYLQLAGICFIPDGSRYATITNLTLFAPALVALVFFRQSWPSLNKTAFSVLIALCVWVAFVAVFNEGSAGAPWKWLRLVLYVGLYALAIGLVMQSKALWRVLLLVVVCTAALFAWLSLFQALLVDDRGFAFRAFRLDSWAGHKLADFANPIVSALYFGVVAIMALCLSLREKGGLRLLSLTAFLGASAYCYFTYSRGVWVGLLAAIVAYLAVSLTARQFRMLLWGFTPLCIAGFLFLASVGGIDASYRDEIFLQWSSKIGTFWLWGAGAGADPNICIEGIRRCFNQAHSLYLQFFFEYGLPGLLLLLLLIAALLLGGWRYRSEQSYAPLGLALMVFVVVVSIANYYVIFLRPSVFWIVFWLPVSILLYEGAGGREAGGSMMPMLKSMKRYWCLEILGGSPKEFSWRRLRQKCKRSNRYAYLFWFRIAYVLHAEGGRFWKRRAKMLNERISRKYNVEIMLGATVGEGLWIAHPSGIVISAYSKIGKNFKIWQGCTIGIKGGDGEKFIFIGDNVSLCVNSCIIGDAISIADNVVIGAMTLVNKDISSAGIYVNKRVLDGFGCGSEAQSSS